MLPIRYALINLADRLAQRLGLRVLPAAHLAEMVRDLERAKAGDCTRCESCGATVRDDEPMPGGWLFCAEDATYVCGDCAEHLVDDAAQLTSEVTA